MSTSFGHRKAIKHSFNVLSLFFVLTFLSGVFQPAYGIAVKRSHVHITKRALDDNGTAMNEWTGTGPGFPGNTNVIRPAGDTGEITTRVWLDAFGQIHEIEDRPVLQERTNDVPVSSLPNITIKKAEDVGFVTQAKQQTYLPRGKTERLPLKREVVISRDCGRAANLGGRRFFIFCDTEVQVLPLPNRPQDKPYMSSFGANSFAYDYSTGIDKGKQLELTETGMYDDAGRISAWVSLTKEENEYNGQQQRQKDAGALSKSRLAVWFESGVTTLSNHRAVLFAPIVNITATVGKGFTYGYLGNTAINITAAEGKLSAPSTDRFSVKLFTEDEVNFGSFSSAYFGGKYLYVLGTSKRSIADGCGVMIGRVPVDKVPDRRQYRFWDGKGWSMHTPDSKNHNDKAVIIKGGFSRGDIFFSRLHGTFIFVYMNGHVDSTFYYRKLLVPKPIEAPFPAIPKSSSEWDALAENIWKHPWSTEETVLLKTVPHQDTGFNYAGSVARGFFGEDDISEGGNKLLLTWTIRTGRRAWERDTGEYHTGIGYVEFEKAATSGANN